MNKMSNYNIIPCCNIKNNNVSLIIHKDKSFLFMHYSKEIDPTTQRISIPKLL